MSDTVTLYQLAPSPNSIKVRLALGLKKIACKVIDTDVDDDAKVIEVSTQPLRPVLVHGTRVVWDSRAILRYIDQTWPKGPRLFSADADTMYAIEEWETYAGEVNECIGILFEQMGAPKVDAAEMKRANELLAKATMKIEEGLGKSAYLMGDAPNAADITLAPWVGAGLIEGTPAHPIPAFFGKHLQLPKKGFDKTRAWVKKIMALDGAKQPSVHPRGAASGPRRAHSGAVAGRA